MSNPADDRPQQPGRVALARSYGSMQSSLAVIALIVIGALVFRPTVPTPGELIWLAGFAIGFLIRWPYGQASKKNEIVTSAHDRSESVLLPAMFLGWMVFPVVAIATSLLDFATYRLPGWVIVPGALLQVAYLWLFWRSHADLGRNWSPGLETRASHQIVDTGVYARMRHPMYAAIWIQSIAQPLLVHNWLGGAFVLVAFTAMYFIRVPREEAMMLDRFGDAYRDYMSRTGRVWPKRA